MGKKKILFVDDDETWRKRVSASFGYAEYETLTAADGTEAMDLAQQHELGVIVLDVNLDGEDGLMLLKFLRHNNPGVPIVLFSGVDHNEDQVRKMLDLGAEQYISKNSVDELLVTVGTYMR